MTVQELILRLDNATEDTQVLAGNGKNYKDIVDIQEDENGNIVLVTEDDEITTNLTSEDDD